MPAREETPMQVCGRRMQQLRRELGLTLQDVGERLGRGASCVTMYECGRRIPPFEVMIRLADLLQVDLDYLCGRSDVRRRAEDLRLTRPRVSRDNVSLPLVEETSAGAARYPIPAREEEDLQVPASYLRGGAPEDFFLLRIHGDSMHPVYRDGDIVLVRKTGGTPRFGEVCAVQYGGGFTTLKKTELWEDRVRLVPLNKNYPVRTLEGGALEDFRIVGVPRYLIRQIES